MTLSLTLPKSWNELTQEQLLFVFKHIASNNTAVQLKTLCFFKWAGLSVHHSEKGVFYVEHEGEGSKKLYPLTASKVNDAIWYLSWLEDLPRYPLQIEKIGKHQAVRADFQGVPFGDYLTMDNLYQGYLQTKRGDLLQNMAKMLYQCDDIKLNPTEEVSVFYWFSSVKQLFGQSFKHFFKQVNTDSDFPNVPTYEQLRDRMNAQIRALTGGDITKEQQVLEMDCWRALTELDAKARESEELKAKTK